MSSQGATRTATGSRIVSSEMSANIDIFLKRFNRGYTKFLRYMLSTLQHRIPKGTSFRITGEDGSDYWRTIRDTKDLEGDFDIEVSANSESSNKQAVIETAQQILQMTANPLDIQLGLVSPLERYNALKNYYQALGIKNWRQFVVKVDESANLVKLTPEEVFNRVLRGDDVKLLPNMDLQGFVEFFQHIHDNDDLLGQFNEQQTVQMAKFAQQAGQMLQALKAQQAQQANAQQMRTNSQMSAQQAPTALAGGGSPTSAGPGPAAPSA